MNDAEFMKSHRKDNGIYISPSLLNEIEEVSKFIEAFSIHHSLDVVFSAGACYYFACILKDKFNRGCIVNTYPYSHFAWLDENGIAYDIRGCRDLEYDLLIPENDIPYFVKACKHIDDVSDEDIDNEYSNIVANYISEYLNPVKERLSRYGLLDIFNIENLSVMEIDFILNTLNQENFIDLFVEKFGTFCLNRR